MPGHSMLFMKADDFIKKHVMEDDSLEGNKNFGIAYYIMGI